MSRNVATLPVRISENSGKICSLVANSAGYADWVKMRSFSPIPRCKLALPNVVGAPGLASLLMTWTVATETTSLAVPRSVEAACSSLQHVRHRKNRDFLSDCLYDSPSWYSDMGCLAGVFLVDQLPFRFRLFSPAAPDGLSDHPSGVRASSFSTRMHKAARL